MCELQVTTIYHTDLKGKQKRREGGKTKEKIKQHDVYTAQ
jgi:hypothetical protein